MLNGVVCSEADLKRFHNKAIEQYVEIALRNMARAGLFDDDLGEGLKFHNQSHALQDGAAEVEE